MGSKSIDNADYQTNEQILGIIQQCILIQHCAFGISVHLCTVLHSSFLLMDS